MTEPPYDPELLYYWLLWRLKCSEATFDGFQQLFEQVMVRFKPGFQSIRPYGNIGDRKSDGWLESEGTVYQVYAPDELKQSDVQQKIEEDLAGAVEYWASRGLKKWVFVYNVRRGLPPDIPGTIAQRRLKYPGLELSHMDNNGLWNIVSKLSSQQRAEILGPPQAAGLDVKSGLFVVVHDILSPIDIRLVLEAINPNRSLGPPLRVHPDLDAGWEAAATEQRLLVRDALAKSADVRPRFGIFALSPIPLLIHLGYVISDRVQVDLFQYDRERKSWTWDAELARTADLDIMVTGVPKGVVKSRGEVVVRVSLSARIATSDTATATANALAEIDIGVHKPSVMWLRTPEQLLALGRVFREVLQLLAERLPAAQIIHLFYAGPVGGAIVIGQAINPRMNPPVALYEYHRQRDPRFELVLTLDE
jgi:hypothetical protein